MNKKEIKSQDKVKALFENAKRFCGLCKEDDTMLICMECRRKDLEQQKLEFKRKINELIIHGKVINKKAYEFIDRKELLTLFE